MPPDPPAPAQPRTADAVVARPAPGPEAGAPQGPQAPRRPDARFLWSHPAHIVALGFGSGLSPWAPGTMGTLWAWLSFIVGARWLGDAAWASVIAAGLLAGVWACTRTAQHLAVADPGAIVWDEIVAFWIVLWLLMPAPLWMQALAFGLFRWLDAAKPGPVGWADRLFKPQAKGLIGWRQGAGILLDDLVAAFLTLLIIATGVRLWNLI